VALQSLTLVVDVPVASAKLPQEKARMAQYITNLPHQPISVLVVDDDQDILKSLTMLLRDEGYRVLQAPDGLAALNILCAHHAPLIVLTDHHMPVLDGAGLLRRVLAEPTLVSGHAYVYMTAGSGHLSPDVHQLLATLDVPVLYKPFGADDVLDTLAAAAHRLRIAERTEAS
jgi:CheY-like chemotaxis protein